MYSLRKYEQKDCEPLAKLFYDTVHEINIRDYTEEQANAWATGRVDLRKWNLSFSEHYTVVAEYNGLIVGFGDISYDGYLDRLYVHKDFQGRGIATQICNSLEKIGADKITTCASITAKDFFVKRGYIVVKEQQVSRNNVLLTNFVMIKHLND